MSAKNNDEHNRFRSKTIAFRVSPEEDEQLNIAVSLSGLTKQNYIISKVSDRKIYVQGSCKIHRAVYDRLTEVLSELRRIDEGSVNDELTSNITLISHLVNDLYHTKEA